MPLQPLTPTGVQNKLSELYALPDNLLFIEADAIQNNFSTWMKNNFSLSTEQKNFLDGMNDNALDYFGYQCGFCFTHRLDISLDYPTPPEIPNIGKWPEVSDTIHVAADGKGSIKVVGMLKFTMLYK